MEWLNYHHLFYFWMVAKEGTVSAAAKKLHLARPTVTAQIRDLEAAVGKKLFIQKGRRLILSDFGEDVFTYADEIFAIGHELREFIQTGQKGHRNRFRVGITDVVPKWIVYELLRPALAMQPQQKLECHEGRFPNLLSDLGLHKLDLVISDVPASESTETRTYNHDLGQSTLSILAAEQLAKKYTANFPHSLHEAPLLLPTDRAVSRRALDRWLETHEIIPDVIAECEDSALLNVFGQAGEGLFVVPTAIEKTILEQYSVKLVGRIPDVVTRFFAITIEKRVENEATALIIDRARSVLRS